MDSNEDGYLYEKPKIPFSLPTESTSTNVFQAFSESASEISPAIELKEGYKYEKPKIPFSLPTTESTSTNVYQKITETESEVSPTMETITSSSFSNELSPTIDS